jgi:carboxymethylenebutenolidase
MQEVMGKSREAGGPTDENVVGDAAAIARYIKSLPISNGKIGVIGFCSGGRHSYLVACKTQGLFDAAVDCWGGNVVQAADRLTPAQPTSPLDFTKDLSTPLLGLFGNDDQNPNQEQVNTLEEELKKNNKDYEFHRYDGAGHGIFYYFRDMYRQQQADDGWQKVWAFFDKHLKS